MRVYRNACREKPQPFAILLHPCIGEVIVTTGILSFVTALLLLTGEADGGATINVHRHFIQGHFVDDVPGIFDVSDCVIFHKRVGGRTGDDEIRSEYPVQSRRIFLLNCGNPVLLQLGDYSFNILRGAGAVAAAAVAVAVGSCDWGSSPKDQTPTDSIKIPKDSFAEIPDRNADALPMWRGDSSDVQRSR